METILFQKGMDRILFQKLRIDIAFSTPPPSFRLASSIHELICQLGVSVPCQNSLGVTEAFEKFMEACVNAGAVVFPKPPDQSAVEAEARLLLAWLEKGQFWISTSGEEQMSVKARLLTLLHQVRDDGLKQAIEQALKKC